MTHDETIIEAVLRGDTEAFSLIVERYSRAISRMVRNITCDGIHCEDIAQEVFLAAYRKLGSYDASRSRFSTWLFTIARNHSINALKKKSPITVETVPERVGTDDPTAPAEREELMRELDRRLAELPGKLRRALVLAEFEGLEYEEIARIERTRVGTIKSRIHRARSRLRIGLERFTGDTT